MAKAELLLEVRCEEIPARMLTPGVRELATRVFEELMARQIAPREVETGFTPRRLVLVLRGLPERQPDREESQIGPPVSAAFDDSGQPTAAAVGFARRCGVAPAELERVETEKGEYLAARRRIEGGPTAGVLAELLPRVLNEISWARTMRWGAAEGPWVRPVHGVVAVFDGEVVDFELFGVRTGNQTLGHPILSPKPFTVRGAADYKRKLERRGVIVDYEARREILRERLEEGAARVRGQLVDEPELLDRLAAICGIPGVVEGRFKKEFLDLPREVLVTSLRDHQSAFSVESARGKLKPVFLTIMDREDDPDGRVKSGNEWVVDARLADARFFYGEDRRLGIADRRSALERLTFQEKLGSYADKSERIRKIADVVCDELGWAAEKRETARAADLLKVDLTTEMVKEFTSLQGIMGGVYAREEGYPEEVWQAIYDQYLPVSSDGPIPRGRVGQVTALADRVDTLVGIFGLGLIPTGSKDPFGLRRAAQGVVRIALEGEMALDLDLIAAKAFQFYGDRLELQGKQVLAEWRPFLFDRVRHLLGRQGYAYDEIEAGLSVGGTNLPDLRARVDALHAVRDQRGFLAAAQAAKRIANIVKGSAEHPLNEDLLREPAERELHRSFRELKAELEEAEAAGDYRSALGAIAGFADVLDRFFVEVLVMDENRDLRNNRIAMLQSIQRAFSRTAALTEVVVDRSERQSSGP